jgi:hypothetical protein
MFAWGLPFVSPLQSKQAHSKSGYFPPQSLHCIVLCLEQSTNLMVKRSTHVRLSAGDILPLEPNGERSDSVARDVASSAKYAQSNCCIQGEQGAGLAKKGWEWVGPGGKLHPEEFLERFHGHLLIEALLAVVIGYLFFQQSFKWSNRKIPKLLSEEVRPSQI